MTIPEIIDNLEKVQTAIGDDRFGKCEVSPDGCGDCIACCLTEDAQFGLAKAIADLRKLDG